MEGDDPMMAWVILSYLSIALLYGSIIFMAISELVGCFLRWRSRRDAKLAADRLLESVTDVPYYHPLPPDNLDDDAAGGGDEEEGAAGGGRSAAPSSCVICLAEYEHGERCFVMPACAHMFHRGCVATWLRQGNTTCPICRRATTTLIIPAQQQQRLTTAEAMV